MSKFFRYTFGNKAREKQILQKMLKEIDLEPHQKVYIQEHFLDILYDEYEMTAIKNKIVYQSLRIIALVAGLLVPIVANLSNNLLVFNLSKNEILTILGICSSLSFWFLQVFKNKQIWLYCREIFEIIRSEGYEFLNLCGEYSEYNTSKEAFQKFSNKLETLIKKEIKNYSQLMEELKNYY